MEPDEQTRRMWLLRLGAGTVLTGFSGMDLTGAARPPLPAGLYEPSADHLAHVLKPAGAVQGPAAPLFFTAGEYRQLGALIAKMLGEDDAQAAPVPEIAAWIDLLVHDSAAVREAAQSVSPAHRALAAAFYREDAVHELEPADAQQICRAGLARLQGAPSLTLESLEAGARSVCGVAEAPGDRRVLHGGGGAEGIGIQGEFVL